MTYGYIAQNPYFQHPSAFANTMQQMYGNIVPQQNTQSQISPQSTVIQSQTNGNKIILVSNKEEATGTAVDLINGTPTFFYNKSNGEIYLKQFDIPTGKGIFKTYIETQPEVEKIKEQPIIINYDKQINYLIQGMDNLHRMIAQLQEQRQYPVNIKEESIDIEPETIEDYSKSKSNKKRGQ